MDRSRPEPNVLTDTQVTRLARRVFERAHGTSDPAPTCPVQDVRHGITVDLSHSAIASLPDEVFAIIRQDLERLALSHNYLFTLPLDISHCTSLRYLNVRHNAFETFPDALCELHRLEILDMSQNKLQSLPEAVSRMSSLKVLSVRKNAITDLPLCIGDMGLLQVLKVEGNPLNPALQGILDVHRKGSALGGPLHQEARAPTVTAQIKKFLTRSKSVRAQAWERSGTSISHPGHHQHIPKPSRTGRFPIRVDDNDEPFSPQSRSTAESVHLRAPLGSQSVASAHGSRDEDATSANQNASSQVPAETRQAELERAAETKPLRNLNRTYGMRQPSHSPKNEDISHLRGFGIGAAPSPKAQDSHSAASQTQGQEELLSILQTSHSRGRPRDRVFSIAQALYLSVHQLQWLVKSLANLLNNGARPKSDLDRAVFDADFHLHQLEQNIRRHIEHPHDHEMTADNGETRSSSTALIQTYRAICLHIFENVDKIVDKGSLPLVRILINLLYGSVMVLRAELPYHSSGFNGDVGTHDTLRAPIQARKDLKFGSRNSINTVHALKSSSSSLSPNSGLESKKHVAPTSPLTPTATSGLRGLPSPPHTDDNLERFRRAEHSALHSCNIVLGILPKLHAWLYESYKSAESQGLASIAIAAWHSTANACSQAITGTEALHKWLSSESKVCAIDEEFTRLFHDFVLAWTELGEAIKSSKHAIQTPVNLKKGLAGAQRSIKETTGIFTAMKAPVVLVSVSSEGSSVAVPMMHLQASLGPAIEVLLPR